MRIVVSAGGTGGHIHPALVVAKELRKLGNTVLFIGGLYGPESKMAKDAGFEFIGLDVRGFNRSNFYAFLKALLLFPSAVARAFRALSVFNPDVVIGAGGYASGPSTFSASLKKIPLFLMEQNFYPGLVTRKLSGKALKVFTTFEGSKKYLPSADILVTGNPVREGFTFNMKNKIKSEEKVLLVMGGSQGAHSINNAMLDALPHLTLSRIKIYHQTGKTDIDMVRAGYEKSGIEFIAEPFFENMAELMSLADLAVVRAGATTCAELNIVSLPAILIPYMGAGGHQKLNAKVLEDNGAGEILEESKLTGEFLSSRINNLLFDDEKLELMSANSREMATPFAVKKITDEVMKVAGV